VEAIIAHLASSDVGASLADMRRLARLAPETQDSVLKDSLGVTRGSWRARLRAALEVLPAV